MYPYFVSDLQKLGFSCEEDIKAGKQMSNLLGDLPVENFFLQSVQKRV